MRVLCAGGRVRTKGEGIWSISQASTRGFLFDDSALLLPMQTASH